MEDVGIHILRAFGMFYCHLVYFTAIWYILLPFHIVCSRSVVFCGNVVYFSPFWYVAPRKIWQPWSSTKNQWRKKSPILRKSVK
jgi:hypothetical protein